MIRGSKAHVGANASTEEDLARELGWVRDEANNTNSWWVLPLEIQNKSWLISHFTTMGVREWTRANAINMVAAETILDYANTGDVPPDYVIRAHVHRYADSFENYHTRAISLPAWQLHTPFTARFAGWKLSTIGGIIFIIENGEVQTIVKQYPMQRRENWKENK
jgi:hypothetical protein